MRRIVTLVLLLSALPAMAAGRASLHPVATHKSAPRQFARHKMRQRAAMPAPKREAVRRAAAAPGAKAARKQKTAARQHAAQHIQASRSHPIPQCKAQPRKGAHELVSLQRFRNPAAPPLRGSFRSLERQNDLSDAEGLVRIEDEEDLAARIDRGSLVPVPVSLTLTVNGNLAESHRFCRPWTARFLSDLARAHAARFHRPLQVSSAVRTVEYQRQLRATNGNAAQAEGDIVSPHLTGATIDIAKAGLSRDELSWLRNWLLPLEKAIMLDVEEEFQQACFHITVYKSYSLPGTTPRKVTKPRT